MSANGLESVFFIAFLLSLDALHGGFFSSSFFFQLFLQDCTILFQLIFIFTWVFRELVRIDYTVLYKKKKEDSYMPCKAMAHKTSVVFKGLRKSRVEEEPSIKD